MFGLSWKNIFYIAIAVTIFIIWLVKRKRTVENVKYNGYSKSKTYIHRNGTSASASYNELTNTITIHPGTAPSVRERTIYSVYFEDARGKHYTFTTFHFPGDNKGDIGTLKHNGSGFHFIKYHNQTLAEKEFGAQNAEYKAKVLKKKKKVEELKKRPLIRILLSIWFFISHLFPTILIANLAIIMPSFCTWITAQDLQVKTNTIIFVLTIILDIIITLVAPLLLYAFYFGHILIVPFVSLSCFKKDYPILKKFLIVLLGLVISYATGNMIEPKLTELGMVMESRPFIYWGTMTNTVILCGMATNLLALIFGFFSKPKGKKKKRNKTTK